LGWTAKPISSLVRRGTSPNSHRARDKVGDSDSAGNRENCIFGYGGPWLWLPLVIADWNLTKFGLVPLRTCDQPPSQTLPSRKSYANWTGLIYDSPKQTKKKYFMYLNKHN